MRFRENSITAIDVSSHIFPHILQTNRPRRPAAAGGGWVFFNLVKNIELGAGCEFGGAIAKIPCFAKEQPAILTQRHGQVLSVFERLRWCRDFRAAGVEDGQRIAEAKRPEPLELFERAVVDVGEGCLGIDRMKRPEIIRPEASRRELGEAFAKRGELRGCERQAGRLAMAAKFLEQLGHAFKSFEQVEIRDAATRSGEAGL